MLKIALICLAIAPKSIRMSKPSLFLLIFFLSLFQPPLQAAVGQAIKRDLEIQKLFIEGIKSIEIRDGKFIRPKQAANTVEKLLLDSFEAKARPLPGPVRTKLKNFMRKSVDKNAIRSVLLKTKNFLWSAGASKKVALVSTARRFGFDVGMVYMLSLQIDLTFPSIMIALGHVEFAPLLVSPISTVTTGSYAAAKSFARMNHLIKNLGGAAKAREHWRVYKEVKAFFHSKIFSRHDLIDLNVAGGSYVLNVERASMLSRFKRLLGFNKNLNYKNLRSFLETYDDFGPLLKNLAGAKQPDEVKMLRLLRALELKKDPRVMTALKSRFGGFVAEMDHLPDFSDGRRWSARVSSASSFDEFLRHMGNIPDDFPPKVFDKIWRGHILPQAARNVGPFMDRETYQSFRNLKRIWENGPRRLMSESAEAGLGPHWKKVLADYVFEAVSPAQACGSVFNKRGEHSPLL